MKTLNEIVPNSLAPPIAWGNFDTHPSKAFYLTYFRHLDKSHPASEDLVDIVRRIHQVQSPTGKFGFHVPTFYGSHKVDNSWCDTWEGFFTREMKSALAYSQDMLNHDSELEELAVELFDKVVPRLLRPLETGGRKIKPVLVRIRFNATKNTNNKPSNVAGIRGLMGCKYSDGPTEKDRRSFRPLLPLRPFRMQVLTN